jgi:imidazolonepropionase-like amidohydrolase
MTKHTINLALTTFLTFVASAQNVTVDVPAPPQTKPIALVGGTVHTVSGATLEKATVLFDAGKITAVGTDLPIPPGATTIDATGKHIYPGLFDADTDLGLVEISAVRATRDTSETGEMNPNAEAAVAVNPDSDHIYVSRSDGILLALSYPRGGLLAGQAAVLQLDGWTWEDLALSRRAGLIINWPDMSAQRGWWVTDSEKDQLRRRDEQLKRLRETFTAARAYLALRAAQPATTPIDTRWESMADVLSGKTPVIIRADTAAQIRAALAFAKDEKLKPIILGGYDAPLVADDLKSANAGVILSGVQRMPARRHDPVDHAYTLPARLRDLGIPFAIAQNRGFAHLRNLPYHAGSATGYGLTREQAIRAITLTPAEILGVADRVGSIEVGKHATLIVTTGDVLETPTQVTAAFVQGKQIDLDNRQKRLAEKYRQKYRQQDAASQ